MLKRKQGFNEKRFVSTTMN